MERIWTRCIVAALIGVAMMAAGRAEVAPAAPGQAEIVAHDSGRKTADGHELTVPKDWGLRIVGAALILTAPEPGSTVVVVDAGAADADAAVAAAWKALGRDASVPLQERVDLPTRNGWAQARGYRYQTSAAAGRLLFARALRHGERWSAVLVDFDAAVADKRSAQMESILSRLRSKDHVAESFAGKRAHRLDDARVRALSEFVEQGMRRFDVPGAALGLVQNGEVVFAGGFGVRAAGSEARVDADTLFLSASVTKPLTTLMLAKLVDAGHFGWDTPVTEVLPSFRLADPEATRRMRMRHLVCACTGLPRQDMEWILASEGSTPESVLATLATMRPTAEFGALYQYSNPLAAAAGYVGGHARHPRKALGAAYDRAMQELVFDPLGMSATTFDYARAQAGNFAAPHARDREGRTVQLPMALNRTNIPMRPDGGAWSNVRDLLRYLQMELGEGRLGDGRRYIGAAPLLARRAIQVARAGEGQGYGMGLKIENGKGTTIIQHGGTGFGYQAEIVWLPEHGVGAVLMLNADDGVYVRGMLKERLLEVLFDAKPQVMAQLELFANRHAANAKAERERLAVPADPRLVATLAARYRHPVLGDIAVANDGAATRFDFGAWSSEVASHRDSDGTLSLETISPGVAGFAFVVDHGARTLTLNDAQHRYVFAAVVTPP
jgi:CubicO group peptidase (beta-lactamase class C family)